MLHKLKFPSKKVLSSPRGKVSTSEEYFALPVEQREKNGFYLSPVALKVNFSSKTSGEWCSEWDVFRKEIRKRYPIQWFFREWFPSYDNPIYALYRHICWKYKDIKFAIKNFIKPSFPRWRKTLPRHKFSDLTWLVIESNLNLLLDFWHEEVVDGFVNWQSDESHKKFYKELKSYVNWIEKTREDLIKKANKTLLSSSKNKYKKYEEIEEQIDEKEKEIVKWMVDNKTFLWT